MLTGYVLIAAKFAVGILTLIVQLNIMGKGSLAPTSAIDQVQNYVLGAIIGGVIYNDAIGLMKFTLVLLIWTILVLLVRFCTTHYAFIKRNIDGSPVILIEKGEILIDECLRHGIRANDLHLKLRMNDVSEIRKVRRAILEQNGQLTVIPYGTETVRYPLIVDGRIDAGILELLDRSEEWLHEAVRDKGYEVNEVFMAEWIGDKLEVYPYPK